MNKADLNCHTCGDKGHFASECPNAGIDATGKPPWCGFCDERTRLIDGSDRVARCQECHPLRHQQLKQHRRCSSCHQVVYVWDNGECGFHSGPNATDKRPERERIHAIVGAG